MIRKIFFKNALLFLIPLLIPIIILGTLSIWVTNQSVQAEITRNNSNLLNQMDRSMELISNEMNSLSISFANPEVLYRLEEVLRTQEVTFENLRLMESIQNYINSPANAKPYIESIYVYVANDNDQFLSSGTGLSSLNSFHDYTWMDSFQQNREQTGIWTEARSIKRYSFEDPIPVTTIYKNLYSSIHNKSTGVIVINIYTQYFDRLLNNMQIYDDQSILVVDDSGSIMFRNTFVQELPQYRLTELLELESSFKAEVDEQTYIGYSMAINSNGWQYITLTPEQSIRSVPSQLSQYTAFIVVLSFALSIALSLILTMKNVNHIRNIISIFKSAEQGLPISEQPIASVNNEYDYITQKIIKNFIEKNYLDIQLSEKKYKLQAAELLAMQSQINPHFLFNTLETIYWKTVGLTGKPNEANKMLEDLSDLLKYTMDKPNRIVTLQKEIEHTQTYIRIQKIRYRDKFDVVWDYDPDEADVYSVPKLLLQPIIENCIYHGIKEKEGRCGIKIKVIRTPSHIRISVIDNGVGMTKDQLAQVRSNMDSETDSTEHIGLANTDKRIRFIYGTEQGLDIRSTYGRGTIVSLRVPV